MLRDSLFIYLTNISWVSCWLLYEMLGIYENEQGANSCFQGVCSPMEGMETCW